MAIEVKPRQQTDDARRCVRCHAAGYLEPGWTECAGCCASTHTVCWEEAGSPACATPGCQFGATQPRSLAHRPRQSCTCAACRRALCQECLSFGVERGLVADDRGGFLNCAGCLERRVNMANAQPGTAALLCDCGHSLDLHVQSPDESPCVRCRCACFTAPQVRIEAPCRCGHPWLTHYSQGSDATSCGSSIQHVFAPLEPCPCLQFERADLSADRHWRRRWKIGFTMTTFFVGAAAVLGGALELLPPLPAALAFAVMLPAGFACACMLLFDGPTSPHD